MLLSPTLDADRQRPLAALGGVAVATGLVVTATGDDGVVLCPFRFCTGGYCPGCGGTRAARHLFTGDLAGAWHHHPWVVLAAVQLMAIVAVMAIVRTKFDWRRWRTPLIAGNTTALVAVWVVRTTTGSIPTGWL